MEGRSADSLRKTETRRDEDRQAAKRQRGGVVKVERYNEQSSLTSGLTQIELLNK